MTTIPIITNELGRYWDQPKISDIEVDDEFAIMNNDTLKKLSEYSSSIPSGIYEGKMWKLKYYDKNNNNNNEEKWQLRWYQSIPNNDKEVDIISRKIILL